MISHRVASDAPLNTAAATGQPARRMFALLAERPRGDRGAIRSLSRMCSSGRRRRGSSALAQRFQVERRASAHWHEQTLLDLHIALHVAPEHPGHLAAMPLLRGSKASKNPSICRWRHRSMLPDERASRAVPCQDGASWPMRAWRQNFRWREDISLRTKPAAGARLHAIARRAGTQLATGSRGRRNPVSSHPSTDPVGQATAATLDADK